MDHGGLDDLLESVFVLELRVGVVLAVGMVDASDFREVLELGAVPLYMSVYGGKYVRGCW